jgi:hypothetical protein
MQHLTIDAPNAGAASEQGAPLPLERYDDLKACSPISTALHMPASGPKIQKPQARSARRGAD